MKILFLHPNMPGQYKHLARYFGEDPKNQAVFITKPKQLSIPGVHKVEYQLVREGSAATHRYILGLEKSVLQGQEVWRMCKALKEKEGFVPDVICAHPGWGDALYVKDIFPSAPLLNFFEFYYHSAGADVNFDPNDPATEDDKARVRTKNTTNLLNLEAADWGISPTHWQKQVHPKEFHYKISVLHDGVDTEFLVPDASATLTMPNGKVLRRGDEVVTYVTRNFEHYRGMHTFFKAAELIQKQRPNCHIIAVGGDEVSYGKRPQKGKTFRQMEMEKVTLDKERIHFLGTVPYETFVKVIQVSSAHIYLTYPFVLSWSMLEAMSAGCLIIGSDTPPVTEVIRDGENGLLVDFFSPEQVAKRVNEVFAHKDQMAEIRRAARQTAVDKYDIKTLLPLHAGLVRDLAAGHVPPPTAKKIEALYSSKERA